MVGSAQQVLAQTEAQINNQLEQVSTDINSRLSQLREVNFSIKTGSISGVQQPNDLFDKRDQLTYELSELVGIRTKINENGTVDVFTANNRIPLLADDKVTLLQVQSDDYPGRDRNELFVTQGGQLKQVTPLLGTGGELGGLLEVRANLLDTTYDRLGQVLNGFVAAQNVQHQQGWDAAGNPGEAIFRPLNVDAFAQKGNSVNASVTVGVALTEFDSTDPALTYGEKQTALAASFATLGELKPAGYQVEFDGTDVRITNLTSQEVQTTPIASVVNNAIDFEGLRFNLSNLSAGDRFQVSPHRAMLEQFGVNLTSPTQLATRGQSPLALDPVDLATPAAQGDNINVANLSAIQGRRLLDNDAAGQATSTLLEGYAQVTTDIGRYINRSESLFESTRTGFDFLLQKRESISGVNLDEEAANLLRFQQAYQAAAQVIQTSQSLFQTLLGAVRS
jgi:flagellar hook-associated protein 1 FlgK